MSLTSDNFISIRIGGHQEKNIPGINVNAGLEILAKIGPAPQQSFANSGRLYSWAGLVPRNDESAGKIKSRRILNGNPYLKSLLVQTAWAAVSHRKNEFSNWFWYRQGSLGRKKAIIAVARKMLSLIYRCCSLASSMTGIKDCVCRCAIMVEFII